MRIKMDNKDLMSMVDELREQVETEKRKRIQLHAEVIRLRKENQKHKEDNVDYYSGILEEIKLSEKK